MLAEGRCWHQCFFGRLLFWTPGPRGHVCIQVRRELMGAGAGWERCPASKAESTRWQLDDAALSCPGCGDDFGVFTRKHHCRKCGGIYCDACTTMSGDARHSRWCTGCKTASEV